MDITRLAAKQKRIKDWEHLMQSDAQCPATRDAIKKTLDAYAALVERCWDSGKVSQEDDFAIASYERELTRLNEESRMVVRPNEYKKLAEPILKHQH